MSIDLTELRISGDTIVPVDSGGILRSALNNASIRIDRLGDCYSAQVTTPPMLIEPDGRRWSAKLLRARRLGGIVAIHQPGFNVGAPGASVVGSATAGGRFIPLAGLTPHYAIREGQWLNYFAPDGQRYLDQAVAQVIANASGVATVEIQNLLRIPLTAASAIELAQPCLEGWIEGDFTLARGVERITSFTFAISEKA